MRRLALSTVILVAWYSLAGGVDRVWGQSSVTGSAVVTAYSNNERFYLRSVPFDDLAPNFRGRSEVYEVGQPAPLYVVNRAFGDVIDVSTIVLSDDGRTIVCVLSSGADEARSERQSVTVYRNGELLKSYTASAVTGCDERGSGCHLVFSHFQARTEAEQNALLAARSNDEVRPGVGEHHAFLETRAVFALGDVVYITDTNKRVHALSMSDGTMSDAGAFADVYPRVSDVARPPRTEYAYFDVPIGLDEFPALSDGRDLEAALAGQLGMKRAADDDGPFGWHLFAVTGTLSRDGHFEPEDIDVLSDTLDRARILQFFRTARFETDNIPPPVERWTFRSPWIALRNADDKIARQEAEAKRRAETLEYERRLTLTRIDGVYIPRDLGECLVELDKVIDDVQKQEMRTLASGDDMIRYHRGLGTNLRNRWGLWKGSRLQRYFSDRGVTGAEDMSVVILQHYYDWLRGNHDAWMGWEHRLTLPPPPPPPEPPAKPPGGVPRR